MTSIRTSNNPTMLRWAREEVGYSIEQAAQATGLSAKTLQEAESGNHRLTLNQLRTVSERYNCPFGYFYLAKPPNKKSFEPLPDYRIEPSIIGVDHYRLNLEVKKARDRRLVFLDLSRGLGIPIKKFKLFSEMSIVKAGIIIRERLNISDAEISSLGFNKTYPYWKSKIEEDGVLVYETQYLPDLSGVIGAAISYEECPIILIKRGRNYNSRKLFTLLHEYAHLLKGESGINDAGAQTANQDDSGISSLEVECNRLAAEILIPTQKINLAEYSDQSPVDRMERLAKTFKVTYSTAAVCLKRLNLISQSELTHLLTLRRQAAEKIWQKKEDRDVKIPREYLMRLDMGHPMFNIVRQAYSRGTLDIFDAAKILNLRVNKIDKLVSSAP